MCGKSQLHCSATQLIMKYWGELNRATGMSKETFAAIVREHYEFSVFPQARVVEWSHALDAAERMRVDGQKLFRWLGDDVLKPCSIDLLESVISAFPAEIRFRLQIELAAWQGMITFPMPSGNTSDDAVFLGRVAKEAGDVLIAGAALFEDNVIDSRYRQLAPEFMVQVDEAIASLFAIKHYVSEQVKKPRVVNLRERDEVRT